MALCFLVIAAGMFLISGQYAKAYRTQITYEKQQQDIRLGEEQEKELLKDKQNLDNPEMFEDIARKNGYCFENETVVNVTRPITEEDKWK